ncbi:hypothetical protein [Rhodovulum marinum]|uniref:Uncharacterized protein n=1 Tax=Rhodovulum marinum TaxID=320662 RepID=A0A4R2Q7S5_9RHOB|nr:hypothetical protein [Rhodovulum marinum]TCP43968.1 hypothetical protein EV662_10153 [Rhodovulum marinum]
MKLPLIVRRRTGRENDPFLGLQIGDRAGCSISGFSGIVTARVEYIDGCNQVLLQPSCDESGNYREARWFDVERVQLQEPGAVSFRGTKTGGELPLPSRPEAPK